MEPCDAGTWQGGPGRHAHHPEPHDSHSEELSPWIKQSFVTAAPGLTFEDPRALGMRAGLWQGGTAGLELGEIAGEARGVTV